VDQGTALRRQERAVPLARGRKTSARRSGGKLLMLKEDGLPWEMAPETLETVGQWDFYGAMTSETCTAQPSFDPDTGEMFAFGYEAKGETGTIRHTCSRIGRAEPFSTATHRADATRYQEQPRPAVGSHSTVSGPHAARFSWRSPIARAGDVTVTSLTTIRDPMN
jgi:hypothetical protein